VDEGVPEEEDGGEDGGDGAGDEDTMTLFAISVMMFWMLLSIPPEAWENPSAGVYIGGWR